MMARDIRDKETLVRGITELGIKGQVAGDKDGNRDLMTETWKC